MLRNRFISLSTGTQGGHRMERRVTINSEYRGEQRIPLGP